VTNSINGGQPRVALPTAVTGGGPISEPGTQVPVAPADGVVDDAHRTARHVLTGIGLVAGLGAAGAGVLALKEIAPFVSPKAGIAMIAAGLGAALLLPIIANSALGSQHKDYAAVVRGTHADAVTRAGGISGDVGIVPIAADRSEWGLVSLESNVDRQGPNSVSFPENAPLTFASIVSRAGDTYVRSASGAFINEGVQAAVDLATVDPANRGELDAFVGKRLGVDAQGQILRLGAPMFEGEVFPSDGEALRALANLGVTHAVLLRMGSGTAAGTVVFAANAVADGIDARGADVRPISNAIHVIPGGAERLVDAERAPAPGADYATVAAEPTTIDLTKLDASDTADLASITGQRIGVAGGKVVQLAAPLFGGAVLANAADALARLYSAGIDNAVLVKVGAGSGAHVVAFATSPADQDAADLGITHPIVRPASALTVVAPDPARPGSLAGFQVQAQGSTLVATGLAPTTSDVTKLNAHSAADVASLVGQRIGTAGGKVTVLGAALFGGQSAPTEAEMLTRLYSERVGEAVLVRMGSGTSSGVVAFAASKGQDPAALSFDHPLLGPAHNVTVIDSDPDRPGTLAGFQPKGTKLVEGTLAPHALDVARLDPNDPATAKTLAGRVVGVTQDGRAIRLGAPLFGGQADANEPAMLGRMFEQGADLAILIKVGTGDAARVLAFQSPDAAASAAAGGAPWSEQVHHLMISPAGSVTDVPAGGIEYGLTDAGKVEPRDIAPSTVDPHGIGQDDVAQLTGMRIGRDQAGGVLRLGAPLGVHVTIDEARQAAMASGTRELLLPLADGVARFALPGELSVVSTRLTPTNTFEIVRGPKGYRINAGNAIEFSTRLTAFDVSEPIGRSIDSNVADGVVVAHLGSFPDIGSATAAIRGGFEDHTRKVIVHASGPAGEFHAYELGDWSEGAPAWDRQMGEISASAAFNGDIRTASEETLNEPSKWGTDVVTYRNDFTHAARLLSTGGKVEEIGATPAQRIAHTQIKIIRAFDPNEAVNHRASTGPVSGVLGNYLTSFQNIDQARTFVRDMTSRTGQSFAIANKANNVGSYHVYDYRIGAGGGNPWDTARAPLELASWTVPKRTDRTITEFRPGQYGQDEYVFRITEERIEQHEWSRSYGEDTISTTAPREITRTQLSVRPAPAPAPIPPTSPGDDGGTGGGTSPGDDGGTGGGTSPGDDGGTGGGTSPGDDGGTGGGTSPGDDGGTRPPSNGGSTSPGDSPLPVPVPTPIPTPIPTPAPRPTPPATSPGDSTDNGDPSEDNF